MAHGFPIRVMVLDHARRPVWIPPKIWSVSAGRLT
jgi:hypothetical protein